MKKLLHLFAGISLVAIVHAASAEEKVVLKVDNMYCASCPLIVKKKLSDLSGVINAEVSYQQQTATVVYDEKALKVADLIEATTNAGYPSEVKPNE